MDLLEPHQLHIPMLDSTPASTRLNKNGCVLFYASACQRKALLLALQGLRAFDDILKKTVKFEWTISLNAGVMQPES